MWVFVIKFLPLGTSLRFCFLQQKLPKIKHFYSSNNWGVNESKPLIQLSNSSKSNNFSCAKNWQQFISPARPGQWRRSISLSFKTCINLLSLAWWHSLYRKGSFTQPERRKEAMSRENCPPFSQAGLAIFFWCFSRVKRGFDVDIPILNSGGLAFS